MDSQYVSRIPPHLLEGCSTKDRWLLESIDKIEQGMERGDRTMQGHTDEIAALRTEAAANRKKLDSMEGSRNGSVRSKPGFLETKRGKAITGVGAVGAFPLIELMHQLTEWFFHRH